MITIFGRNYVGVQAGEEAAIKRAFTKIFTDKNLKNGDVGVVVESENTQISRIAFTDGDKAIIFRGEMEILVNDDIKQDGSNDDDNE